MDQVRTLANEKMKQRMSQNALSAATGMSPASALQQQAAVAQQQQHHQHNQQALAAAFAAAQSTMGMQGQLGVGQGGSPTPIYRAMQAQIAQQMQGQSQVGSHRWPASAAEARLCRRLVPTAGEAWRRAW